MPALANISPRKKAFIDVGQHRMAAILGNTNQSGTPIVFIHGITSSIDFWTITPNAVTTAPFPWYSLSLPGHHPATFSASVELDDINAENLAAVTENTLQKLVGDQPVILFGHSTGAWMSLNMAAHYPERVAQVVSVAGFSHGYWLGPLRVFQWWARRGVVGRAVFWMLMKTLQDNFALFHWALRLYGGDASVMYNNPDVQALLQPAHDDYSQHDIDTMWMWFNRMPDVDITDKLHQIQAPVLLIHGTDDKVVAYAQSERAAELIPNAKLVTIAGGGHMVMGDSPEAYNAAVQAWVDTL